MSWWNIMQSMTDGCKELAERIHGKPEEVPQDPRVTLIESSTEMLKLNLDRPSGARALFDVDDFECDCPTSYD